MLDRYRVIGIVQSQVDGDWHEQPHITTVEAESPAQASQRALDQYTAQVQENDAYALVRWHSPELVRVYHEEHAPL